ncbi:hypothetical protein BC835DRAFT_213312 [Cytidiella melzeri]|nr:hypothetical protein BC835DRAFT_213312 [Cytidiella melzeri]
MTGATQSSICGIAGGPACHRNEHRGESTAVPPTRGGRTTGEKAREKRLQEDELVLIITPQLVQCKRCLAEIKLSKKSQYDTFHWYQHRERCLKRSDLPLAPVITLFQRPSWPVATKVQAKKREFSRPTTSPALSIAGPSSSADTMDSPLPLSPTLSISSPRMVATYELSNQAFQRVQQWTLRSLADSYGDCTIYSSSRTCNLIQFEESQVRDTCDY